MHHLLIDHYSRLSSPVHGLDSRVKILITLFFVIAESSLGRFDVWGALSLAILPVFLLALSEIPVWYMVKRILMASPFILFAVVFQPFTTPGSVIWNVPWFGWHVTLEGLSAAFVLTAKFTADILMTLILVSTTPFEELASALRWWRVPRMLVEVMVMMFRYTFVLFDELERIVRTARLRNIALAPRKRRYAAYARVLGVHLLRSFDRAERVYSAMLLRGFRDGLALLRKSKLGLGDVASGALMTVFIWGMFTWRMTAV
jgi:cobalt/nickel transport system permease protein